VVVANTTLFLAAKNRVNIILAVIELSLYEIGNGREIAGTTRAVK